MLILSRGGWPAPPRTSNPTSRRRLAVEVLEGRWVPAPVAALPVAAASTAVIASPQPTGTVAPPTIVGNTGLVALQVQPGSTLPTLQLPVSSPVTTAVGVTPGQSLANLSLQINATAFGFPGRIVFPGSGVQERSATGTGPLTQQPGQLLVGGAGGELPGQTNTPAAPPQGAGGNSGAAPGGGVSQTGGEVDSEALRDFLSGFSF